MSLFVMLAVLWFNPTFTENAFHWCIALALLKAGQGVYLLGSRP